MNPSLLEIATLSVGLILLYYSYRQWKTGRTADQGGRKEGPYHIVTREEMPVYFRFLLAFRIFIGLLAVGFSLFSFYRLYRTGSG